MAAKLNRSTAPLTMVIPEKGVLMLDAPSQPFHDPAADAAPFDELGSRVQRTDARQIVRLPYHINDPEFAQSLVRQFEQLAAQDR